MVPRRVHLRLMAISAVATLLAFHAVSAGFAQQPAAAAAGATRVVLGSDSNEPGKPVVIPIYFSPAQDARASRLTLTVEFDSRRLIFRKMEKGISPESVDAAVEAAVSTRKDQDGNEAATLTIQIASPGSGEPIPSGVLGYVNLEIAAEAPAGAVPLMLKAEARQAGGDAALEGVAAAGTQVVIRELGSTPNVICFFFTH